MCFFKKLFYTKIVKFLRCIRKVGHPSGGRLQTGAQKGWREGWREGGKLKMENEVKEVEKLKSWSLFGRDGLDVLLSPESL